MPLSTHFIIQPTVFLPPTGSSGVAGGSSSFSRFSSKISASADPSIAMSCLSAQSLIALYVPAALAGLGSL